MLPLLGDLFKDTLLTIVEEKSPAPDGNQTHNLSVTRHTIYRCATTTALLVSNLLTLVRILKLNME